MAEPKVIAVGLVVCRKPTNINSEKVMRDLHTLTNWTYIADVLLIVSRKYSVSQLGIVTCKDRVVDIGFLNLIP